MEKIISYSQLVKNTVRKRECILDNKGIMTEWLYYVVPKGFTLDLTVNLLKIWGLK